MPWARECGKNLEEWMEIMPEDEFPRVDYSVNTFRDFLQFWRAYHRVAMYEKSVMICALVKERRGKQKMP